MPQSRSPAAPSASYREVDDDYAGQRLDNYLLTYLKGVPRSHVYRLVRSGQVRVNSKRVAPSYRIQAGDRVRIPPVARNVTEAAHAKTGNFAWLEDRIVYEDERILLVDKPSGLAVHGGSGINVGCIEALRSIRPEQKALELIHRIDRDTSGCLLIAKRRSALRALHGVFRENALDKYYFALVAGAWPRKLRCVDLALATRRIGGEARVRVDAAGKSAKSHFHPVRRFGNFATLVGIKIETGRTHQIRVHAAAAGHPVAGDSRYGSESFNAALQEFGLQRMFLHATSLSFCWPASEQLFGISVPLPAELQAAVRRLAAKYPD